MLDRMDAVAPVLSPVIEFESRPPPAAHSPLPHIGFMDGLRGLAAVFVVFHHAVLLLWKFPAVAIPPPYNWWLSPFKFGHLSVTLFIVLSGFLLTMPIVRKNNQLGTSLPRWTAGFFWRRALRILPPYWFALLYAIIFGSALYQNWNIHTEIGPTRDLVGHILLLHDWGLGNPFSYNGVLWTIPIEWHIYLTVPLLILLWRRFHPVAVATCVVLVAYIVDAVLPRDMQGQVAAWIVFGTADWARTARRIPWGSVWAAGILSVVLSLTAISWEQFILHYWWIDLQFSIATACGIIYMALNPTWPRRLFGSRFMVWLGSFSYSIYLTHVLVLEAVLRVFYHLFPTPGANPVAWLLCVCVPASLVVAYAFYWLFEWPFTQLKRRVKKSHGENPDVATA
jgi:peptidoglycan/LPS O-acetylase OafA/YrhL